LAVIDEIEAILDAGDEAYATSEGGVT